MIGTMVIPLVEMQKAYGREIDLKMVLKGWEAILSDKFSGNQICYALKKYALEIGDDFPSPKNIHDILCPPKPRISTAEFIHAKEQWALENYKPFSYYGQIVKDYERENEEERAESRPIEDDEILKIVQNSVKRIS